MPTTSLAALRSSLTAMTPAAYRCKYADEVCTDPQHEGTDFCAPHLEVMRQRRIAGMDREQDEKDAAWRKKRAESRLAAERWLNDPMVDHGLRFLTPLDPEAVERDAAELSAELHRQTESMLRVLR